MNCEDLRDCYELYCLGLLEPGPEKAELEEHLGRSCPTCHQQVQQALAMQALLLAQAPAVVPPARIKRRLMAAVGIQRHGWTWLAASVAAAMILLALWLSLANRGGQRELTGARAVLSQTAAQRDQLRRALEFLEQPDTLRVGFGGARLPRGDFYLNSTLGVMLIASNLPPAAADRTYQMWLVPVDGDPLPGGQISPNANGEVMQILDGPLEGPTDPSRLRALVVSEEPAGGSSAPTGTAVIEAPLGVDSE